MPNSFILSFVKGVCSVGLDVLGLRNSRGFASVYESALSLVEGGLVT